MGLYWPDYITKPQHLWPFCQTGDYSDQGSVGGLTLTAQGSGNSFTANGLVLNGSGYANVANNADLANLDGDYSILLETVLDAGGVDLPRVRCFVSSTGWTIFYNDTSNQFGFELPNIQGAYNTAYPLSGANQLIVTYDSANDILTMYGNGVYLKEISSFAQEVSTSADFQVGEIDNTSTIKRVAVLKGTAWTALDVAQIYQAFYPVEYWPTGIAMPDHYWPFNETGDYSDLGAIGDLTLTAQGSGNSFDANGLNFNGNGWATGSNNSDVSDLGGTFSIIIDFYLGSASYQSLFGTTCYYLDNNAGGIFTFFGSGEHYYRTLNPLDTLNELYYGSGISYGNLYQIIWVQSDGIATIYKNGSIYNSGSLSSPVAQAAYDFAIGGLHEDGGWKAVSGTYIKRVGFLKGIAWTSDDVEQIFNFFQQAGEDYLGWSDLIKKIFKLDYSDVAPVGIQTRKTGKLPVGLLSHEGVAQKQTTKTFSGIFSSLADLASQLVSGAQQFFQDCFSALTSSGEVFKKGITSLVGSESFVGNVFKATPRAFTATASYVGAAIKKPVISVAGALTSVGTAIKKPIKILSGAFTSAGVLSTISAFTKTLAGALTSTGTLIKKSATAFTAILNSSGKAVGQALKSLSAAVTSSGLVVGKALKNLVGAINPVGVLDRLRGKMLSAILSTSGEIKRLIYKPLASILGYVGTLAYQSSEMVYMAFEAFMNFAAEVPKKTTHGFVAVLNSVGTLFKWLPRSFIAVANFSGTVLKSASRIFEGILTSSAQVFNKIAHTLSGNLTSTGVIINKIFKVFSGLLSTAGVLSRLSTLFRSFTATLSTIGELVTQKLGALTKALSAGMAFSGEVGKGIFTSLSGVWQQTGRVLKTVSKPFVSTLEMTGILSVGRRLYVYLSGIMWKQND